ncbi:MAG: hypothetical protein K0S24_3613, partial [Sphingobacterium sp.]|nr:hypothetical protein [Sphingobacterium sp.]
MHYPDEFKHKMYHHINQTDCCVHLKF